jgi:O-antigen ligase
MLPIIVWLIFYLEINIDKNKNYLIVFFSLYFIVIYLSGERTSFALMNIFLFLSVLFVVHTRKILLTSLTLLVLFISLSVLGNFGKSEPFNRIFIKTFNQITNNIILDNKIDLSNEESPKIKENIKKNIQIFSTDHMGHYKLAYKLFLNQPIFGAGPKGFRYYCRSVKFDPKVGICSTHPHNILIQILSETGILGFIFYFSGLLFLIIKIFSCTNRDKLLKDKNCFLIISIGLFVSLFPLVPGGNFFNNWLSINNYYFLGVYFYSYKKVFN